jgi:tRNA1Val (adenine37-N6)-methyltransferase
LEDKIDIVTGDIKMAARTFGVQAFDVIVTNPPYMIGGHGIANARDNVSIARHEVACTLEDILRESARILPPKGRFYMVHRPFRLAEIFAKMVAYKLEPKRMQLIYPYIDSEPKLVLVEGLKDGNSRLKVESPIVMYERK